MTENDKRRLSSIINVWNETKKSENMHPDFVKDVDWVMWEARSKHNVQQENEKITGLMVKMRETFTERDQQAEGHGMEDVISCPTAVVQYAFNKLERTIGENKRLREAFNDLRRSLNDEYEGAIVRNARFRIGETIDSALEVRNDFS